MFHFHRHRVPAPAKLGRDELVALLIDIDLFESASIRQAGALFEAASYGPYVNDEGEFIAKGN